MSSNHSNGNGNGKHPQDLVERSALEEVREAIETRQAEEEALPEIPDSVELPLSWKTDPVTLETLHEGLLAVSKISEAAIEQNIETANELKRVLPSIERSAILVEILAAKMEAVHHYTDHVDDDLVRIAKTLKMVRRSVQSIREDVAEMKGPVSQIPALKEMLGEILARLPAKQV